MIELLREVKTMPIGQLVMSIRGMLELPQVSKQEKFLLLCEFRKRYRNFNAKRYSVKKTILGISRREVMRTWMCIGKQTLEDLGYE